MYYLISHVYHQKQQSIYGPVHVLAHFLAKKRKKYRVILLPLEAEGTYVIQHGKKVVSKQTNFFSNLILRYFYDLFFLTSYFFSQKITEKDTVIAVDPLNCFLFVLVKPFYDFKLIYYTADYADQRFNIRALNTLYFFLDKLALRSCDQNWCVSSRIVDLRRKQGFAEKAKFVPNTPVLSFKPGKQSSRRKNNLIYVGRMDQNMKIPQLLKAFKKLHTKNPSSNLTLIGGGVLEEKIINFISENNLKKAISYHGPLNNEKVIAHLKKSGIGLALYSGGNNWNKYGDSMKIREYQYMGLPIISTTIPSNSTEVEETSSGIILNQSQITPKKITSAIEKIQLNYKQYTKQAHMLATIRDKEKTLSDLLDL